MIRFHETYNSSTIKNNLIKLSDSNGLVQLILEIRVLNYLEINLVILIFINKFCYFSS